MMNRAIAEAYMEAKARQAARDAAAAAYHDTENDPAATEQDKNRAWRRFVLADRDEDRNEMEPIYRAQDAAHEARYGPRDDGYDDY